MRDKNRKYLYLVMVIFTALQFYIIREGIAVFIMFTLAFIILAPVVAAVYLLQKAWEALVHKYYD